jgi:virginiamycin B lyase
MSLQFPNPQSKPVNRRLVTGTLVVLVVSLVIIAELVPSALAFTFAQFPTLTGGADPTVITLGPDGNLWFTETTASKIGKITPAGVVTEFALPSQGSLPSGITSGPDGALWFTEPGSAKVGRIKPPSSTITEFVIPNAVPSELFEDITTGPDGALWFVDRVTNSLGQITSEGVAREVSIPTKNANPFGITAGPDGSVWFTEITANQIGRFNPLSATFAEFPIPTQQSSPGFITSGPDGALWFTEFNANQIGRITTTGGMTEFLVPTKGSGPNGITSGPDGALWFTEFSAGKIGQLVPTPSLPFELASQVAPAAMINEFTISAAANPGAKDIATGPDRNLWFTDANFSAIGRLTPDVQQVTADLSVSIAAPAQTASGTQLTYTINVNNAGPGTATGVTVNVPTPAGTTFSSVQASGARIMSPAPGTTGTVSAAFGSMAPGGAGRFLVTVNVLAASGTSLSATATVTSTSADPNTANNTAKQSIPVQGGGIVYLSWTRPVSTAVNPTPPPGNVTASAGLPQPTAQLATAESVVEPSDTCPGGFIVGYNIYIASTQMVAIVPANLWVAMVPPDQLNAKVASRPGGTFYAMTTLWNCGGMIVESMSSNTASTCQGPELDRLKVTGKIKIFGNDFTDPATGMVTSVFVDGFPFNKAPIFLDPTFLKQKGTIDVNGTQMNVLDYMAGKSSIVITVQVQSMQSGQTNTCISSISFGSGS